MVYQFESRLAHLTKRLRGGDDTALEGVDSRLVEVRRDGNLLFEAVASVRELREDEKIMYGVSLDVRRVDFIFTRSHVPIGWIPEVIDTITESIDNLICQVQPMGEATWRWTTSRHRAMRVHTAAQAYTLLMSEKYLAPVHTQSSIGTVRVDTLTLPIAGIYTKSSIGSVLIEADIESVFTKSETRNPEPDESLAVPV